jgi:hypothetical protein
MRSKQPPNFRLQKQISSFFFFLAQHSRESSRSILIYNLFFKLIFKICMGTKENRMATLI